VYDAPVSPFPGVSVCHALDAVNTGLDALPACGTVAGCVLSSVVAEAGAGSEPDTVVCPRHFLGIRTLVEQCLNVITAEDQVELNPINDVLVVPPRARVLDGADPLRIAVTDSSRAFIATNNTVDGAAAHAAVANGKPIGKAIRTVRRGLLAKMKPRAD
jgi:hypothetical protein